jgi:hopene-associated glycosyltransferase HpnB
MIWTALGAAAAAVWLYLLTFRGGFWRARIQDDDAVSLPPGALWPSVTVVIPARNEAEHIGMTLRALLDQHYDGELSIVVVDDGSADDTARIARGVAATFPAWRPVTVIQGGLLPEGWTGKLWALQQALTRLGHETRSPEFILFTDADIYFQPDALAPIVARAMTDGLVLTSLMAKLRCVSAAERFLLPAFIFFFQMLYPFEWVKRPDRSTAAAAGGCMLVRYSALQAAGGLQAIRAELIDDCALARLLKQSGAIWVGLTDRVVSLRRYATFTDIGQMVARTAYAQLRFSPVLLLFTMFAMTLSYIMPPVLLAIGPAAAQVFALFAWLTMALMFQPTLRFYRVSRGYGIVLPVIAAVYLGFTLRSAYQYVRGGGGAWKGRTYRPAA